MRYRPNNVVIGYYDSYIYSFGEEKSLQARFGYPSCKWLQENKFTEVSRFSSLTKGIKPHTQRNAEIQINKDLRVTVDIIENDFIDGFKIRDFSSGCVIVEDPRGFCVALEPRWLRKAILSKHCSLTSDGHISGKWAYVFFNKKFETLLNEDDRSTIDINDTMIDARNNGICPLKEKDLEVGAVYDVKDEANPLEDVRHVYVGKFKLLDLNKLLNAAYTPYSRFNDVKKEFIMQIDGNRQFYYGYNSLTDMMKQRMKRSIALLDVQDRYANFPWNNEEHVKCVQSLLSSEREVPVFIKLKDQIAYKSWSDLETKTNFSLEDLLDPDGKSIPMHENSIVLSPHLKYSSIVIGDRAFLKRIIKKSDAQNICMKPKEKYVPIPPARLSWKNLPQCYTNDEYYKTYSIEDLVAGINAFKKATQEDLDKWLKLLPIKVPDDPEAYKKVLCERLFNEPLD